MSDKQPYADAVAHLMSRGYLLEEITVPEVIQQALDDWLKKQILASIEHHGVIQGVGHQPDDRCESWYALRGTLTQMQADSRRFVTGLLKEAL